MRHLLFTTRCTRQRQPTNTCQKASNISGIILSLCPVWQEMIPVEGFYGYSHVEYHLYMPVYVPLYTVEPEVHPHIENVWPQVCVTKPQRVLCRGSRQARIPGQKYVKKTASHLPTCDDMYADVWYSHLVTSHLYNCTTSCVLLSATVRVIVLSIRSHQTDYI